MDVNIVNSANKTVITSVDIETLFPAELHALLQIPTTAGQAAAIELRNKEALKELKNMRKACGYPYSEIEVGCPHCNMMQCEEGKYCGWSEYILPPGKVSSPVSHGKCILAEFGGVDYEGAECIMLTPSKLVISLACRSQKIIRDSRIYLEGHVEWAQVVRALGQQGTTARDLEVSVKETG